MKRLLLFCAVPLLFSGCLSILPDGKAPEGRITDNTAQKTVTPEELENAASTALTAYILLNDTVQTIEPADTASARVLESVSGVTGIKIIRNALYRLEMKNGVFQLRSKSGTPCWQYPEK